MMGLEGEGKCAEGWEGERVEPLDCDEEAAAATTGGTMLLGTGANAGTVLAAEAAMCDGCCGGRLEARTGDARCAEKFAAADLSIGDALFASYCCCECAPIVRPAWGGEWMSIGGMCAGDGCGNESSVGVPLCDCDVDALPPPTHAAHEEALRSRSWS